MPSSPTGRISGLNRYLPAPLIFPMGRRYRPCPNSTPRLGVRAAWQVGGSLRLGWGIRMCRLKEPGLGGYMAVTLCSYPTISFFWPS